MYKIKEETLSDIADAIRSKSGSSETIKVSEFAEQIETIPTGSDIELIENLPIAVDFSQGNQFIEASEGQAVKSAVIQKPENLLPENIAEGINIAGIIGALAGGGVSFKTGDITGAGAPQTMEHNLGVTPDVFIIVAKSTVLGGLNSYIGFSYAFANLIGHSRYGNGCSYNNGWTANIQSTAINRSTSAILCSANAQTISVGSTNYFLKADTSYTWLAIGGLT